METLPNTNIEAEKEEWVKPVIEIIGVNDDTLGGFSTPSNDLAFGSS